MEKFLSWDFAFVIILALALFIVHEYGHYLAYRVLGIPAKLRRSVIAPGVDPKETICVKRWKGLFIALGGFFLSNLILVLPLYAFSYKHWFVLFLGSFAGSIVDFAWALSMLSRKTVTLQSRG